MWCDKILHCTNILLGIPGSEKDEFDIPRWFESEKIHVSALIVADYVDKYSHWSAAQSLHSWLEKNNVPALCGNTFIQKISTDSSNLIVQVICKHNFQLSEPVNYPN